MCLNGDLVRYEDAKIHAFSAVVKYGTGVFEGIRGYWNDSKREMYVFRLREHVERMRFGMKIMRFDEIYDAEWLEDCLLAVIRKNDLREDCHFRMIAFMDGDDELAATGPVGLVIGAVPRTRSKAVEAGVSVGVSSWTRISDNALPPRVKATANYVNNRAAEIEAKVNGYDGVLILTQQGKVSEGSGACLFVVRDGALITPDVGSDILESVTRDTVIRQARDRLGLPVIERALDRTELYVADEAFLCGSGWEVVPVTAVDRLPVGDGRPGPITRRTQEHYFDLVYGRIDDHPAWRRPVYQGR
jgi:branched-chain amino acid aminotransferase